MTELMRSWMFVPGNKQRFLDKAAVSSADAVFLDLEDGVLPDNKSMAREMVSETLGRSDFSPLRYVRVNAVDTPWFEGDLGALMGPCLDGICLPKVEDAATVAEVAEQLDRLDSSRGHGRPWVQIVAAIESARGLLAAADIALSHPRVTGLMFGAEDYALDIGLGTAREDEAADLIHARSVIVVAAAAARVLSIDGVFPNLDDPDGLTRDVWVARRLGFDAKSTFNPRQIEEINQVFSPQPREVEYARRVVAAFEEARKRGDASVAVGGQLVDLPIVRRAQRLLEITEKLSEGGGHL